MIRLARLLVLPLALLGACSHPLHPVEAPRVQLIAESYSPAEIRAALIRALDRRKFVAEREDEGMIMARWQKKDQTAHVAVEYTQTQFGVRYLDSAGFAETKDPTSGALMVDSRYDDMIATLEKVIVEELRRPAKERADAERHQREYDAMMQMARTAQATAEAQAASANAGAAQADAATAQANADAAQANADAAQAQANAPPTTIINKTVIQNNVQNVRKDVVINNNGARPAWPSFCDKPVKAVWSCPSQAALNACMASRSNCTKACRVGGGC
jgi:hypothetical protein